MWLIAGLGNPGEQYARTRHNVGFMVVDALHRLVHGEAFHKDFHGLATKSLLSGQPCLLLKPQTFMNRSGESIQPAAAFYKIPPERIIVIHDELDLPFGEVRVKRTGGHAGHNGVRDTIRAIGGDFIRIRVGVGRPPVKGAADVYVLANYRSDEQPLLAAQIETACAAVGEILQKSLVKL